MYIFYYEKNPNRYSSWVELKGVANHIAKSHVKNLCKQYPLGIFALSYSGWSDSINDKSEKIYFGGQQRLLAEILAENPGIDRHDYYLVESIRGDHTVINTIHGYVRGTSEFYLPGNEIARRITNNVTGEVNLFGVDTNEEFEAKKAKFTNERRFIPDTQNPPHQVYAYSGYRTLDRWDKAFLDQPLDLLETIARYATYLSEHHPEQAMKETLFALAQRVQGVVYSTDMDNLWLKEKYGETK